MMPRVLIVLLVVFTFYSCDTDDNSDLRELNSNRQLWESFQVKNYSWNERLSCFCAPPYDRDIFVVNEVKTSVEFDESGIPPENLEEFREYIFNSSKTIEEAFDFIESLLSQDLASLNIEYDAVYGFPKSISIDYIKDAVDDEIGYIYTDFEITN